MDSAPLFSVITPSYNQAAYIEGCIQSVLDQGVPPDQFEHLVFDNCSDDGTLEILARHPHVRVVSERDKGQGHALNKGLAAARGRIICWLNSDDQYAPGAFAVARRELIDNGRPIIFGNAREVFYDGRGEMIQRARWSCRADFLRWWDKTVNILQPAVFFTRDVVKKTGLIRDDLHLVLDTEWWWRMSEHFPLHYVDEVLAVQLRQPASKTIRQVARMYEEKKAVFRPLRRAAEGWKLRTFLAEHIGLGWRYLQLAQSMSTTDSAESRRFLQRSIRENFLNLIHPRFWRTLLYTFLCPARP